MLFTVANALRSTASSGEPSHPTELGAVEPGELDQLLPTGEQWAAQLWSSERSREQLSLSHILRIVKQRCGEPD